MEAIHENMILYLLNFIMRILVQRRCVGMIKNDDSNINNNILLFPRIV